ncbi:MAG: hypothetical protein ACE5K9_08955 [Candidatus Methylomirabilales bacterium]
MCQDFGSRPRSRAGLYPPARRYLVGIFGFFAVFALGAALSAAGSVITEAKETTKELTGKNASTLIGVSSAVPEEFRLEVIEILQGLELSRDRILISLDRIEEGLVPPEAGMKRVKAIAAAEAQREKEFLQGLKKRVPAPVVPRVERALQVSADSWQGILLTLRVPEEAEEQGLPPRPGFDIMVIPRPFGAPPSGK